MGALIETKGTQRLARLFNERFNATNLPILRGIAGLTTAFGSNADSRSLLAISDQFRNKWTDGSDALYPSATVTTVQAAAGVTTLAFSSQLPAFVHNGMHIHDETHPAQNHIPKNTSISNLANSAGGPWTVTTSNNVTVSQGDTIVFSYAAHPNLVKRWRHYLANDLEPGNHSQIQTAIYTALNDPSYIHIRFTTVEDVAQKVFTPRAFNTTNSNDDAVDPTRQHMQIILLTKVTTAPDPLDPQ
jgi:hypothetical protein